MPLPEFVPNPIKHLLNKLIIIYGVSNTGKSTIIKDFMYLLKPHIDQAIIFSPNEEQNNDYCDIVPRACIHDAINPQLLDKIWKRQQALVTIWKKVNDVTILQKLFTRLNINNVQSSIDEIDKALRETENKLRSTITDNSNFEERVKELRSDRDELIAKIYIKHISENKEYLESQNLDDDEKLCIDNLGLNPKLLLVFEDVTHQMPKLKSDPSLVQMSTAGRWQHITLIIGIHNDTNLTPAFRNAAKLSIFTEQSPALVYVKRSNAGKLRSEVIAMEEIVREVFTREHKWQKLVYVSTENKYYRWTATKREKFTFVSPIVMRYCELITAENTSLNNNIYLDEIIGAKK